MKNKNIPNSSIIKEKKPLLWLEDYVHFFESKFGDLENFLDTVPSSNRNPILFPKIQPLICIAKPNEAFEIKKLIKETYKNTYPYKQFENEEVIATGIENETVIWFLYKVKGKVVGTIGYTKYPEQKSAKLHGLILKKEYFGQIHIKNAVLISMLSSYKLYKNKILQYFGEARTRNLKGQAVGNNCGMKPVALFPNKDFLLGEQESSFLLVAHDEKIIREFRSEEIPHIIPEVVDFYMFCDGQLRLGRPIIWEEDIQINKSEKSSLLDKTKICIGREEFGTSEYILTLNRLSSNSNSKSFFKIEYDKINKNMENGTYHIEQIVELDYFLHLLKKHLSEYDIRYMEVFVSAYHPDHQQLFIDNGFYPCGYIPSYSLNQKSKEFEDVIPFCWFKDELTFLKCSPEDLEFIKETNFLSKIKSRVSSKLLKIF